MPSLAEWLRERSDEELAALLRARPDLATPPPADTSVLATRVGSRSSVARACEDLDAFALSTLEALCCWTRTCTRCRWRGRPRCSVRTSPSSGPAARWTDCAP